ncbi:MAG: DNA cytosine methyltransferase [Defluviitaleaceae bacterium]|nr:DNA cytosine methyltransferase [Defluviitaleaceae bacterium]
MGVALGTSIYDEKEYDITPYINSYNGSKKTVLSLFAGVGGVDLGFELTSKFNTVYANEIDTNASITFKLNFPHVHLDVKGIEEIKKHLLPKVDVVTSGFPCQAFSIAGYQKGFDDHRGHLFFETMEVVKYTNPEVVFLENVKNLVGHDKGKTFEVIIDTLKNSGYYPKYKVLNAKDYGNIPQNRERIYIVAFKSLEAYKHFEFPRMIRLSKKLNDVVEFDKMVDDYYYYTEEKNVFFDELKENVKSQETVYQWRRKYVRENQSGVCPTLTANMGTGGHNVPLIKSDFGIRKLTERECFNIQGFPSTFELPKNIARSHLYKQAGNSVVVPVIERIATNISIALENVNQVHGE